MPFKNPRRWSASHAILVGAGAAAAAFISLSLDFGGGSFFKGLTSAANYLIIFGFALIFIFGATGGLTIILGRLVGTTVTTIIAVSLLAAAVVVSYFDAQPISRFRGLVWESAPRSITIKDFAQYHSFSDGTTRTFFLECDSAMRDAIIEATGLGTSSERLAPHIMEILFHGAAPPAEAEIYTGGDLVLVYLPSLKEARIVSLPGARN